MITQIDTDGVVLTSLADLDELLVVFPGLLLVVDEVIGITRRGGGPPPSAGRVGSGEIDKRDKKR